MAKRTKHEIAAEFDRFINAIMGLEDDAGLLGYSEKGRETLMEAVAHFEREFRKKYP